MSDAAKEAQKGLRLLAKIAQHAAIIGGMGNSYNQRYLHKGKYRGTRNWHPMGHEVYVTAEVFL
jgi:hypothetical protein